MSGQGEITFLPAGLSATGYYSHYSLSAPRQTFTRVFLKHDIQPSLASADSIAIQLTEGRRYNLELPDAKSGVRALAACQADLLKSWGIDAAEQARVAAPPIGNPASLLHKEDYPVAALQRRQEGKTETVLTIDEVGAVEKCSVVVSSGSSSLDDATCSILNKAKFHPARDKDGRPVPAHVLKKVNWALPR